MATVLGHYELVKKIATGGMAEVFLAQAVGPMGFSKTLVVKRILPGLSENEEFVSMFLNEARLAALLNHANVVQIFDLGNEGGSYFLAMELINGPNLRDLNQGARATGERLPIGVAMKIMSLACEGLAYAHEFVDASGLPLRLVHRDISPHNILLSRSGDVKVADFGIAKAASIPSITRTGKIKGKLKYMSPEQLRDQPLDLRSDLWAMGITLYEILTGARPFEAANEAGVILAILNHPPAPLASHEVEGAELLQPIIDRALAKDRDARYASARDLQTDLERALIARGAVVRGLEIAQAVARFCPPEPSAPPATAPSLAAAAAVGLVLTTSVPPAAVAAGPVLTSAAPPAPEVGPILTQFGARGEAAPEALAPPSARDRTDENPVDRNRTRLVAPGPAPPPVWTWVQRHPVTAGLTVGVSVVAALLSALAIESRELRASHEEQARFSAPLQPSEPLAVQPAPEPETPVMNAALHPVIGTVADDRPERAAIDEPGGELAARAAAEAAKAAGKAAPPIPKRHLGPVIINYGFLDLSVVPVCQVDIDRTPFGTTPLAVPLEPGTHSVSLNCKDPAYHERFNVLVAPGSHQVSKLNLRKDHGTVASALVNQPQDSVHRTSGRRSSAAP